MRDVLSQVSQVKQVPIALARKYGLCDDADMLSPVSTLDESLIEVPSWRHAVSTSRIRSCSRDWSYSTRPA